MEDFGGMEDDGGVPPSSFNPPLPAPSEAHSYPASLDDPAADPASLDESPSYPAYLDDPAHLDDARSYPAYLDDARSYPAYPAYLDDPASDPGRADFECRDWEAEEGESEGNPVILHPVAVAARNRQRAVEALLAGLAGVDAAEAKLHALRVLMVRGVAGLLGADAQDELARSRVPSLTAAEIAAERSLPPREARALVAEALALTAPEATPVLTAMQEGRLDRSRAQTILRAAAPLPADAAAGFFDRAVAVAAPATSPDSGQPGSAVDVPERPSVPALSRALRRMAEEHSAQTLTRRARQARERRRVDVEPGDDGMCHLWAYVPLEAGAAIDTRLQAIARAEASSEDPRTTAQRRADAFTDLLLAPAGSSPAGGVRTEIVVTIPSTTLIPAHARGIPSPTPSAGMAPGTPSTATAPGAGSGSGSDSLPSTGVDPARDTSDGAPDELAAAGLSFGDAPGEVLGYGPIDAEAARRLAAQADTWLRVLTDPQTGAPLALGRTRYTPPPALRRFLAARDQNCRFPACDRPYPHTEADHTHEWSRGGTTDPSNLAILCSEHHRIKTLGYWTAVHTGTDGTIVWTSPLGRTHTTTPGLPRPHDRPPDRPPEQRPPPF